MRSYKIGNHVTNVSLYTGFKTYLTKKKINVKGKILPRFLSKLIMKYVITPNINV